MKTNLVHILTLLIASMLIVSILPAFAGYPTNPKPATSMWIEPATIPSTSRIFTVIVWVNTSGSGHETGAWQFRIVYEEDELDVLEYGTDSDYFFSNITTWGLTYSLDVGKFEVCDTWKNGSYRAQGYGTLQWIKFEMTAAIPKGGAISGTLDLDKDNSFVLDGETEEDFLDATYDATYNFPWVAPPTPVLDLNPRTKTFDKYNDHVGEEFPIEVFLSDLSAEWYLLNASLCLCYNTTLIDTTEGDVVIDSLWQTSDVNVTHAVPDEVTIFVANPKWNPNGTKVMIATITFTVMYQGVYPAVDNSSLTFCDVVLMDHAREIPVTLRSGWVAIEGLLPLPLPWLAVVGSEGDIVIGPEPSIGKEFTVKIQVKNLHFAWYLVAVEFRLTYDPTLINFTYGEEGPYFPEHPQPRPEPPYTYCEFWKENDGLGQGPHILGVDFILPVDGGEYPAPLPGADPPENGTIAILHFKVLKQDESCYPAPEDYFCNLKLFNILMIDRNGSDIPFDTPQNGTVTILGSTHIGRRIDVYTQYLAPFGGQGLNQWSDMFWPQKEVILCANVTYNCWPVQQKIVHFVVYDPRQKLWAVLEGITNEYGVACASFRIPWPCADPESLFGVWTVRADVDIACEIIIDTLWFHFDYLVHITEVTTNKYYYAHCEDVEVTVTFTSYARQEYSAYLWVTIYDDLNVPIAIQGKGFTIGGEDVEICRPKTYIETFTLHIEKFAFAGPATVHAVPRMYWGGDWVAAGPEDTVGIFILAEWA